MTSDLYLIFTKNKELKWKTATELKTGVIQWEYDTFFQMNKWNEIIKETNKWTQGSMIRNTNALSIWHALTLPTDNQLTLRMTTNWQPTLRSFISHFRIESISFPRSTLYDASLLSSMPIIERFKPVYECWNDAPLTNHTLAQTKHSNPHNPHSRQRRHVFHIYSSLSRWPSLNSPQLTHIGMMYLAWSRDIICLTKACTQFFTHSLDH